MSEFASLADLPVYMSFDIDCVDPAYAPGTGTRQVGGLDSFDPQQLIRGLRGLRLVGVDVVEVSPSYDSGGITSLLAANLLYEFLCVLPSSSVSWTPGQDVFPLRLITAALDTAS